MGSVKKGEDLVVRGGAGKTVACAAMPWRGFERQWQFPPTGGPFPQLISHASSMTSRNIRATALGPN